MMETSREPLAISLLEHFLYCPRQAALIALDGAWRDNVATVEGTQLHQRADNVTKTEVRKGLRIARGLRVGSEQLGLNGRCDIVEFHRLNKDEPLDGSIELPGSRGRWKVVPVEYKRGARRYEPAFEVQLCAQALCLEEMLGCIIHEGCIFFGKTERRATVAFTEDLRSTTFEMIKGLRDLLDGTSLPPAVNDQRCRGCSLIEVCLPKLTASGRPARALLARSIRAALEE